jgi:E3 ubiquitin-protein ligase HUWE1
MKEVMTEDHQKLCFFMQVLSEIFESFPGTRLSIMYANDPKGFIMFLLNQLAFPNLDNIQEKMKKNESLWTSHLISVLFSGDIDAPLRNMILECIAENIKESHGQYGRYLAFVDLINKLLLLKSTSAENLVKMMMEHNFLSLLTAIIAEVDLTYPDIKILMSSVLKALESLSKLANKVSRTGPRSKMLEYNLEQPRMDSSFIRDSALGIFGQPNDNSSESSEDSEIINEMEDMEMEEMDDEQDYSDMSEEEVSNAESEDSEDMDVSVRPAYPTLDEDETDIDEDEEHDDMDDDDIDNSPNSNGEDHSEGWSDVHEDNEEEYLDDEDGDNVMHIDVEVDDMDEMGEEDEDEEDISDQEHFSETYSVDGHVMATHDQRHRNRRHNDFFQNFRTNRANISFLERGQTAPVFLDDNGPFSWRGEGLPVESSTHPLLVNPQTSTRESDNPNNRVQIVNSLNTRNAFLGNDVNNAIEMLNSILNSGVRRGDWSNLQEGTAGRSQIIPFSNASGGGFAVMAGSNLNATTEDSNISKTEKSDFHLFRQVDRWAQESKIMHGNLTVEEMSKVNPKILGILIPLCKEEEEKKRIEEEEEKRAKEEKEKEEQERKKKEEEREKEEREKQEQQEKARAESEAMEIDAGTSAAPETSTQEVTRQMVMIEGHEVDLTDTGIDVSFLEALPEDMRGEVLRQHFREQNRDISSILPSSGVAADFLDALPDDIREEIMHQEEMDSAFNVFSRGAQRTFDGPSFLQNIFSGRRNHDDNTGLLSRRIQDEANGSKDLSLMKEPALIFDRNTILTICRLLFFPHTTIKLHFNQVMYNICENSKSRGDLLHLMIGIINECSTLSTADKKGKSSVRKSLCASVAPGFVLNGENSSPTVVSRCLELCLDLLSKNDHIGMFFLVNENVDNGDALPNSSAKKKRKKGIPLISLLELLEKELFLKNPALMDMLTQLIALAVRPVGAKEKLIGEDETY